MNARRTTHLLAALAAAVLAGGSSRPATAAPALTQTFALHETTVRGHAPAVAPAYGWPVKPFGRQHPVRAFLDDPRIGHEGATSFHFGIDVAAPDGTPVYAVAGGIVRLAQRSLCVVAAPGHTFGYWHVRSNPALRDRQVVAKHQLLGWIAPGWGHVHFDERIGDTYVNPLRPGALGPYADPIPPTISALSVRSRGGTFDLAVRAHDTTWPPVPGPWAGEPVTPALVRWRIGRGAWHVAADFRERMLDRGRFAAVYAPETTQNHRGEPGTFAFNLVRGWRPGDGTYRLQLQAADTRGNRATATVRLTVAHGEVRR